MHWNDFVNTLTVDDKIYQAERISYYGLNNLGIIKLSGPDTVGFLQGQLTNDTRLLEPNQGIFSAFCNHQGRINALIIGFTQNDSVYLLLDHSILESAIDELKKFAIFSKLSLEDVSEQFAIIGFTGHGCHHAVLSHFGVAMQSAAAYACHRLQSKTFINLPEDRMLMLAPVDEMVQDWHSLTVFGHPCSSEVWHYWQLVNKIPQLAHHTFQKFLPHRIGLQHLQAISFDKGCYVGQEIIARTHYKAKLKHEVYLKLVASRSPIAALTPLHASSTNQKIGEVIDACLIEGERQLLLINSLANLHEEACLALDEGTLSLYEFELT